VLKFQLHVFENPNFLKLLIHWLAPSFGGAPFCGLARGSAACLAVIVIPYSTLRGNNRITDSCQIRNYPRKENRKNLSAALFYFNSIFLQWYQSQL